MYRHHTGYPGGLKETPFWRMQKERPEEIIRRGVYGMLPRNELRRPQMRRLLIFPGNEHPYEANLTRMYEDPDLHVITPRQWADMSGEELQAMHEQVQKTKLRRLFPGISLE
jgi:large subunit ribosomal protein L13